MTSFPHADIPNAIADLYAECEIGPPEPPQTIVPLGELVGVHNLSCVEISGLTIASAYTHLGEPADGLDAAALAGFLLASQHRGVILVEHGDPITRRRFSVAHELGHYLLHFKPAFERAVQRGELVGDMTDAFPPSREANLEGEPPLGRIAPVSPGDEPPLLPPLPRMEVEADRFAAELLMPGAVVRALCERYAGDFDDADLARRLAVDMLVSRAAMFRRLRDLQIIRIGDIDRNSVH